ncbi:hypothetical protein [Flammeovirga sp. EKP202]|uniref:hypothetical protein n=1 Tax=Flammeovirga sp. EKP202 TaxID=2770592 RepID=UPI00165F6BD2|nr:hypothetical protein [Flammeovirga sp. EKP202]MBD0405303.1 hypothetical protein [Flammeovirga sp. EKP202]
MNQTLKLFFESLEQHSDATQFGTLDYGVVGMEGMGLNPNDIMNGNAQNGTRIILSLLGNITGKIEGVVNGRDFLTVHTTESFTNIHGVIVTKDGQRIAVKVLGETTSDGQVNYQIQLRHNGEAYQWVNEKYLFAKGDTNATSQKTALTIYAFDENPLETTLSWDDPDVSKVDYQNFPFILEDFEGDEKATVIYTGNGHLNTVESFGADVNKVFSGQVPIPEEGMRLNGYFSGPTTGNINGVISGVNYLRVMPDGSMRMNSKIIASTYEGETLLLEALGASFMATGPAWWETSRAVSNLEKYAFLTQLHNLGVGSTNVQTQMINYNHFGFEDTKLDHQQ